MDTHKKELIQAYKQKPLTGGVCITRNVKNGRYLLEAVTNPQGTKNRFEFQKMTGSCVSPLVRADWKEFGNDAFTFEILEELSQKEDQTREEFLADVKALGELWAEKFDPALSY